MWAALLTSSSIPAVLTFLARRSAPDDVASAEGQWNALRLLPLWLFGSFIAVDRMLSYTAPVGSDASTACANNDPNGTAHGALVVVYLTLLVSTVFNFVLSGTRRHSTTTLTAVVIETMMVISYGQVYLGVGSALHVRSTWWGGTFLPSRVNLWCHSSITQVRHSTARALITPRWMRFSSSRVAKRSPAAGRMDGTNKGHAFWVWRPRRGVRSKGRSTVNAALTCRSCSSTRRRTRWPRSTARRRSYAS